MPPDWGHLTPANGPAIATERDKEIDPILNEIEAFMNATGTFASTFGLEAIGDPGLIAGLRAGRELRRATAERVRRHIAMGGW